MSAIFAYYFPQFYETKENSMWWGAGFTDWKLVEAAKPLFAEHYQPRVPELGYYDQSELKTLSMQVDLAKQFNITGFNFYHYWFDGEPHLAKPAEMLLADIDLNIKFMLTWANESWTRQWVGQPNDYLIEQNYYRDLDSIEKHYFYLAAFFKDDRYHKVNNRPVFTIYRPELIPNLSDVISTFNKLAVADGFSGIHWLACRSYDISGAEELYQYFDGIINFNPRYIINTRLKNRRTTLVEPLLRRLPEKTQSLLVGLFRKKNGIAKFSYVDFLRELERSDSLSFSKPVYHSVFPDWDNTARYNDRATLFTDVSPENYKNALSIAQNKITQEHQDILFINAWNEWSEGAYLEPDQKIGLKLLTVTSSFSGF
ncbi:MAG: hypothetical protein DI539_25505 [Flavobacterium psychrophilum]|nr:MAG: hypothetical protein DI539_25505 [Flavobacterium psychrophilum]